MTAPVLRGSQVVLTPLAPADAPALRLIREEPEVQIWWDPVEPDFPLADEPEATRFTIRADDEIIGMIQYAEETEPKYRSAGIDIFLSARAHRRGYGSEAVRLVARHLLDDRGHHRLQIDPAAHNLPAIACYRKAGFTPVGTLRLAERDADGLGWHDALLMELVEPPTRRS